ncbi:MAG: thiamine diphosphokinase [Treponema sp.]|nr:thiamine diphosphokinase [Treponema sp.]
MLGVIFTGAEAPKPQVIKQILKTQRDALFIAADSGLTSAENAGIKPDWIIGDMDSLEDTSRLCAYPQERIIRLQHEKDFSDTEMAVSLAVDKGCKSIWIIGGGGGRTDHLFAIRSLFEREHFPRRWITGTEEIFCIDAQQTEENAIHFSLKSNASVSVFPLGDGPWKAVSTGLKWPLEDLRWSRGFFGLSNVAQDGEFAITAHLGRFMILLSVQDSIFTLFGR